MSDALAVNSSASLIVQEAAVFTPAIWVVAPEPVMSTAPLKVTPPAPAPNVPRKIDPPPAFCCSIVKPNALFAPAAKATLPVQAASPSSNVSTPPPCKNAISASRSSMFAANPPTSVPNAIDSELFTPRIWSVVTPAIVSVSSNPSTIRSRVFPPPVIEPSVSVPATVISEPAASVTSPKSTLVPNVEEVPRSKPPAN